MLYASEFLVFCTQVRALASHTVTAYADALEDFEKELGIDDPRSVTTRDVDTYLSRKFMAGKSPATRRARLTALKAFFRFLTTRNFIGQDPAAPVSPPRIRRNAVPTFTEAEIQKMIFGSKMLASTKNANENDFSFARRRRVQEAAFERDTALLALTYSCALRSAELGAIRNEHFWTDANGVPGLIVMGKSATEATRMRVDKEVGKLIDAWLLRRLTSGIVSEFIFCGTRGGRGISARHVRNVLMQRAVLAGMNPAKRQISPHVLRYSRATHMYAATKDILAVQVHLRHASVDTTQTYIRLGSLSSQAKLATNSLPWNRKGLGDLMS